MPDLSSFVIPMYSGTCAQKVLRPRDCDRLNPLNYFQQNHTGVIISPKPNLDYSLYDLCSLGHPCFSSTIEQLLLGYNVDK